MKERRGSVEGGEGPLVSEQRALSEVGEESSESEGDAIQSKETLCESS
jgi:hypothetical protein